MLRNRRDSFASEAKNRWIARNDGNPASGHPSYSILVSLIYFILFLSLISLPLSVRRRIPYSSHNRSSNTDGGSPGNSCVESWPCRNGAEASSIRQTAAGDIFIYIEFCFAYEVLLFRGTRPWHLLPRAFVRQQRRRAAG